MIGKYRVREANAIDNLFARARGFDGCDSVMERQGEKTPSDVEVERAWFYDRKLTEHERRVMRFDLALRFGVRFMLPHPSVMRGYLLYSVVEQRRLREESESVDG